MKINSAKKVLLRRLNYLKSTFSDTDTAASFNKAEISALDKAIKAMDLIKKSNLIKELNETFNEEEKKENKSQVNAWPRGDQT